MDWQALRLSLLLGVVTLLLLLPSAVFIGRALAFMHGRRKPWLEGLIALPLVLPPTVFGYYLLRGFAGPVGRWYTALTGTTLAFSFAGLVIASFIVNIPFAVQPVQRAFEGISADIREAAQCCGLTAWQAFWRIELPLAWRGVISAAVLTFAHTLGEFGVVMMIGGNIPGSTKTISIAIYDEVQSFHTATAGVMALTLLGISLLSITLSYSVGERRGRR